MQISEKVLDRAYEALYGELSKDDGLVRLEGLGGLSVSKAEDEFKGFVFWASTEHKGKQIFLYQPMVD